MDGLWDLLIWLICIGGTSAGPGATQAEYARLLDQQIHINVQPLAENDVREFLKMFLWSDKTFERRWAVFWAQVEAVSELGEIGN